MLPNYEVSVLAQLDGNTISYWLDTDGVEYQQKFAIPEMDPLFLHRSVWGSIDGEIYIFGGDGEERRKRVGSV